MIVTKTQPQLTRHLKQPSGFALLLTLVVISVILAVGLSLLHITLKQLTLSSVARESEIALHTANSGIECMRWHRKRIASDFEDGGAAPVLWCVNAQEGGSTNHSTQGRREIRNYRYRFETPGEKCLDTSLYILDATTATNDINHNAQEGLDNISCQAGGMCTVIFSRGHNRPCDSLDSIFTVQRELTIQY